ncbi:MAG TPA: YbfB/YjiJ family MFS transporter [Afifellaceae bacterium]|nr:YbfB/YjiJ family MFS transporter [Afifellaceae bacterium]
MRDPASSTARLLAGGFLTLAIVMGIGRFHYTPLLPLMQREFGFGANIAGLIASANFAGYLAGSLLASAISGGRPRLWAFRAALVASAATTLAMGLTDSVAAWLALRAVGGIASAVAMLAAAGIVAEALARVGEEARVGWLFGGVGAGMALSALMTRLAGDALDSAGLWIAAGLVSALLAPIVVAEVGERRLVPRNRRTSRPRRVPRPLPFWPLFVNYACQGLGYSVFATFIVAIVKARPGFEALGDWVWVMAGLAGLPSCLLWAWAAERIGFANALILAYVAQTAGVALPALSEAGWAALLGAGLFGGTFLGITMLTLPLGRHGLAGRGFAVSTAGFGVGQMLGPLLAGVLMAGPADHAAGLLSSAGVLAVGTLFLVWAVAIGRARRAPR